MSSEDMDNDRILDTLLKSLSQTEKELHTIINYIVEISSSNLTKQCNCTKYYITLSSKEYAQYKMNANSLKQLVNKSMALKDFSEDLTGKPKFSVNPSLSKPTIDNNSIEIFGIKLTKLTQCSNKNYFLKEANKIAKLSSNPQTLITQILIFLDLIGDLLISVCSLKQPDTEVEILSAIFVADVFALHEKYSSIWNDLDRIGRGSENELNLIIHNNKCPKSKHLSLLFSKLKEYLIASLSEICKVKFYYNDFVIFMEGFKYKKSQDYLRSRASSSSTETQNVLSDKDLFKAQDGSIITQDGSVFPGSQLQLTNTNDNINYKNQRNTNDFDLVNFKLLENQANPSEKTNEKRVHNLNSGRTEDRSTTEVVSNKSINIEENTDESYLYIQKFLIYLSFYDSEPDTKIKILDVIEEADENIGMKTSNSEHSISVLQKNRNEDNKIKPIETIFIKGISNRINLDEDKYSEIEKVIECSKTLDEKESATDGTYCDIAERIQEQMVLNKNDEETNISKDMYLLKKHRFENYNTVSCYAEEPASIPKYQSVESISVKKSMNVATQVTLETVDISSQTTTWSVSPSFNPFTSSLSVENGKFINELPKVNTFFKQFTNYQDKIALNKIKNMLEPKWPVNVSYIPCTYNYKIKSDSYSQSKKYKSKNQVTAYDPSGIKQSYSKGSQIVRKICRKYACLDLTKERNKFMDFLNTERMYHKILPYGINSYNSGLSHTDSALLIQRIRSDCNVFSNDLSDIVENKVSLHYFNTKSKTGLNWKSVLALLTSSKFDRVSDNLLAIENNTSNEFSKSFGENKEISFRLFDINGYPITDAFGNVLKDPYGRSVVDLSLLATNDIIVYDVFLNPSDSTEFNPSVKPLPNNTGIKLTADGRNPLLLFDKYKRPLTDSTGTILENNHGRTLVRCNELGQPVSDHRGGALYSVNGVLWAFKNEKECEIKERHETSEKKRDSELDKRMGEPCVEWIKAKIQEPLPIIDDIDLSLGRNVGENKSFKLVSLMKNENFNDLKSYSLNQKLKLDSVNDIVKKESNPATDLVDSILSMDRGVQSQFKFVQRNQNNSNENFSRIESGISIPTSHKTVTCKTPRKICKSNENIISSNVHSIIRGAAVNREIRDKNKYDSDSADDPNGKQSNCLEQNRIPKHFPTTNHQKPCLEGDEHQQRKSDSKHKHNKFVKPKETHDKKIYGPKVKTRKRTQKKCLRKGKQSTGRSCRNCNKSNTSKHIYCRNGSNENKSTAMSVCFHAPVKMFIDTLGKTWSTIQSRVKVKQNKETVCSKCVRKQKIYDRKQVNQRLHGENSVHQIFKSRQFKKHQYCEETNSKTFENLPVHSQRGKCLRASHHDKVRPTILLDSEENPSYDYKVLGETLFHECKSQTKDSNSNTYWGYINDTNLSRENPNIEYLSKRTKLSIPSTILKPARLIATKESKCLTPPSRQLSSTEKNSYFYDSLKNLNTREFELKYYQECRKQTRNYNTFTIPHKENNLQR